MKNYKKLSKSGGITIPRLMRQELGFFPGTAVDISTTEDGGFLIRKHIPCCHICGSTEQTATLAGFTLCKSCCDHMGKELEADE
ncbi:AbrB/MazE/SpoVT family DNA-binding domain-containing protein [Lachnospiraceae bacterium 54-53]